MGTSRKAGEPTSSERAAPRAVGSAAGTGPFPRTASTKRPVPNPASLTREEALRLYADGMSVAQVAKKLGRPRGTVSKWIHAAGIGRDHTTAQRMRPDRLRPTKRCASDQELIAEWLATNKPTQCPGFGSGPLPHYDDRFKRMTGRERQRHRIGIQVRNAKMRRA